MSQPPKNRPAARQVTTRPKVQPNSTETIKPPQASQAPKTSRASGQPTPPRRTSNQAQRSRNVPPPPPKRDAFPYIMGAVIGALIVSLMLVVYLISSQSGNNTGGSTSTLQTPDAGISTTVAEALPASEPPPRMPIEEFQALYSSANPPVVIDVRSKAGYDEGHIKGAISYPEAEVDSRSAELPKDKLIVAYCQ